MSRIEATISDKVERRFVETITTIIAENKELKETYEKMSEAESDNLHSQLEEAVSDFFGDLSITIEY